jgi:hypothetical protein
MSPCWRSEWGGPNGAGKTTFARPYADVHGVPYLSADRIAADRIAADFNPEDSYAVRVAAGPERTRRPDGLLTVGPAHVHVWCAAIRHASAPAGARAGPSTRLQSVLPQAAGFSKA